MTRVTFVMVSAVLVGMRGRQQVRTYDNMIRSSRIMFYPIIVGFSKALYYGNLTPIHEVLKYFVNGNGDFTFSILIAIGTANLLLPLLMVSRSIQCAVISSVVVVTILERATSLTIPEFWKLMCISVIFAGSAGIIESISKCKSHFTSVFVIAASMVTAYSILVSEDMYWTIRKYTLYQILILLLIAVGALQSYATSIRGKTIGSLIASLGRISFQAYISHYGFYVILAIFIGFRCANTVGISCIALVTTATYLCYAWCFEAEAKKINKLLF
jgi:hypothetical protein